MSSHLGMEVKTKPGGLSRYVCLTPARLLPSLFPDCLAPDSLQLDQICKKKRNNKTC